MDWIESNLQDEVDFVVWTGDSARHDIDLAFPRSMPEIFALNKLLSNRIRDIFGKHVPIIPSFGKCTLRTLRGAAEGRGGTRVAGAGGVGV